MTVFTFISLRWFSIPCLIAGKGWRLLFTGGKENTMQQREIRINRG